MSKKKGAKIIKHPSRKLLVPDTLVRRKQAQVLLAARKQLNALAGRSGDYMLLRLPGLPPLMDKLSMRMCQFQPHQYLTDERGHVWIKTGVARFMIQEREIYESTLGIAMSFRASTIYMRTDAQLHRYKPPAGDTPDSSTPPPPLEAHSLPLMSFRRTRCGYGQLIEGFHYTWRFKV